MARVFAWIALRLTIATAVQDGTDVAPNPFDSPTTNEERLAHRRERKHTHAVKCGQPPDVRDCRPDDDVAARLHTECAGWNEKDPLKRFTDEHRMKVLDEVIDRGVHICTKQGSDEVIRAAQRRRRLLGLD